MPYNTEHADREKAQRSAEIIEARQNAAALAGVERKRILALVRGYYKDHALLPEDLRQAAHALVDLEAAAEKVEQRDQDQMLGCSLHAARAGIDGLVKAYEDDANMALGSILSDIQELILHGRQDSLETARQYLNRVKWALFDAAPIELWWTQR